MEKYQTGITPDFFIANYTPQKIYNYQTGKVTVYNYKFFNLLILMEEKERNGLSHYNTSNHNTRTKKRGIIFP